TDPKLLNFFGSDPYTHYRDQINDLIMTIRDQHFQAVILPAGLTTSFAPLIKQALPEVNLIGWMHNNY
ncbi:glycosyl transferase family 1, partial [Vibrio parahaemolyticus]